MVIAGAGGHAKEILDIITPEDKHIYFFDNINMHSSEIFGKYPILKNKTEVENCFEVENSFVLGVGNPKTRFELSNLFQNWGGKLRTVISNRAFISVYDVNLGLGLNIMHNVIIYNNVKIGEGSLINTASSIHHDVTIGDFCEISPGARILGGVTMGNFCFVGAGAIILPKVVLGNNIIVGAGAVVNENIPDNCTVVGIPAKPLK